MSSAAEALAQRQKADNDEIARAAGLREDTGRSLGVVPFRGRSIGSAKRVFVYRKLSSNPCWSVKAMDGPYKGLVVAHADSFALYGCRFWVDEKGRQRVLRERRKNVHAGVIGEVAPEFDWVHSGAFLDTEVRYNPYYAPCFYTMKDTVDGFNTKLKEAIAVAVVRATHVHFGTDGKVRAGRVDTAGPLGVGKEPAR